MELIKLTPQHLHFTETFHPDIMDDSVSIPGDLDIITTPPDFDINNLYDQIHPEGAYTESIAPWLIPILDHHKNRIITLARNAELGRLNVQKLEEDRDAQKLPSFIANLKSPAAQEGLPGLQENWDEAFKEFQKNLLKCICFSLSNYPSTDTSDSILINTKKEKIQENMNLTSLHGLVLKDFMKQLKHTVMEKINSS